MISKEKLIDWLNSHNTDDVEPEVRQLIKNLLIEMEFGAFDYEEGEEEMDDPYA